MGRSKKSKKSSAAAGKQEQKQDQKFVGIDKKGEEQPTWIKMPVTEEEMEIITHRRETGSLPNNVLVHSDVNALKKQAKLQELQKLYKSSLKTIGLQEEKIRLLMSMHETGSAYQAMDFGKIKKSSGSQSVAIALASDWHCEEGVDEETVNGLNKFNLEIAEARIVQFFRKTLYLTNLMRNETEIQELILALLGDLISGYIHPELVESNQLSPTQAIMQLCYWIRSGLDFLVDNGDFDRILVPTCFGNHGRTTQKRRVSTAAENSYEYLLYGFLAMLYENHPVIQFKMSRSTHNYVTLYKKYTLRFHHGDNIRYHGGVGGITIPVNKAIAQWNKAKHADFDFFGHYHQMKDDSNWVSNGSLIGYNPFAISIKADYEPPRQTFITIERDKGKTFTAPIILDTDGDGAF